MDGLASRTEGSWCRMPSSPTSSERRRTPQSLDNPASCLDICQDGLRPIGAAVHPLTHAGNPLSSGELNERERQALQAMLFEYTATAEPVGPRQVAKKHALGLSPATI